MLLYEVRVPVTVVLFEGELVGEILGVTAMEADTDLDALADGERDELARVGDGDGLAVGLAFFDGLAVGLAVFDGVAVGLALFDGVALGLTLPDELGEADAGVADGEADADGVATDAFDGDTDCDGDGDVDGDAVGVTVAGHALEPCVYARGSDLK
jgi:hypothetical protein